MRIEWVRDPHILAIIAVGTAILFLLLAASTVGPIAAQKQPKIVLGQLSNATTGQLTGVTNFTELLSNGNEFRNCEFGVCVSSVDVLYQSPTILVLKSGYIDIIWKAVDLAQKEGYRIAGLSTYSITTSEASHNAQHLPQINTVNTIVAMSRG